MIVMMMVMMIIIIIIYYNNNNNKTITNKVKIIRITYLLKFCLQHLF